MTLLRLVAFVAAALRISVPYTLTALGGTLSERAGVVNIALEGFLLVSAFTATLSAYFAGSATAGVAGGVLGGALLAALYALLVLELEADPIVCGVGLNLLADGATRFFLRLTFGSSSNSPRAAAWPTIGAGGAAAVLVTVALLVLGARLLLGRTRFGLRLRAVGEHPIAAASAGVRVSLVRWLAVLASGGLAGLGGAWLAADQHQFVGGMSNGRGYIALAAMIFGRREPVPVALACVLFGAAEGLQIVLQTGSGSSALPGWLVQMLPYVLTLAALAARRSATNEAQGNNVA